MPWLSWVSFWNGAPEKNEEWSKKIDQKEISLVRLNSPVKKKLGEEHYVRINY